MAASRDKILREAEKLVQRGKVEQAIREYEKLLKKNPTDANTINRVGDLYGRVGQIDKAVELYERIAEHFTQDGFTTKAIAILKKINRLAPQRLDIFGRLAELYIQQGLVVEAKSQYQILADWYLKNEEHDKAIETHRRLVQLDPHNHMAHLRLADLYMQSGDTDEALGVYQKLGDLLLKKDKLDEAERLFRHALDQDPPTGEFLAPLCEAFLTAGRTAAVREFLHAALQRSPDSRRLRLLEIRSMLSFGESAKALDAAESLLGAHPDDVEVRALVARALLSGGEAGRARDIILPTCELLLKKGEFGSAQKLLKYILGALPQDKDILRVAVRAYRPSGDQRTLFDLSSALAESCFVDREYDQAQRLFMELLDADPQNEHFRQRLAAIQETEPGRLVFPQPRAEPGVDVAQLLDEPHDVLEEVEVLEPVAVEAPEERPPDFDAKERLAEARVFAKYGLLEKATAHLEDIIRLFPDEVEARAILVSLYVEQGEREAALPVARPLYEHYLRRGDQEAVDVLLNSLPELDQAGPQLKLPETGADEDVIVLDLDQAVADEAAAAPEIVAAPPAVEPAAAEELLEEDFVIDLDAGLPEEIEEAPEPAPLTVELPAPAPVASSPLEFVDEVAPAAEPVEELVEISDSFAGPSNADLDQLDFFIEQSLHEDAIRMLGRLESEFPEDSEVGQRRLALKAKGVLLEDVVAVTGTPEPEELFADEEESYIDLAKELEQELAEEEAMVDEATGRGKEEALLEEVFREFQKGVAEQLSESDTDTHFNLGIAYKEMGLLPEAIREFQVASRDPLLFIECCSMIGVCYVEQGMWSEAAGWYQRALATPDLSSDANLALSYDLASVLESAGDHERAAELYEQIASSSPSYRDVASRLNLIADQRQAN